MFRENDARLALGMKPRRPKSNRPPRSKDTVSSWAKNAAGSPERAQEVEALQRLASSPDVRVATRAAILLAAFEGGSDPAIARRAGCSSRQVWLAKARYIKGGVAAVSHNTPLGMPPTAADRFLPVTLQVLKEGEDLIPDWHSLWLEVLSRCNEKFSMGHFRKSAKKDCRIIRSGQKRFRPLMRRTVG